MLNPAEPPLIMRDTVFTLSTECRRGAIEDVGRAMVAKCRPMCRAIA